MKVNANLWLGLAILANLLAIGLPYAKLSYHQLNLPDALFPGLLLTGACALLLTASRVGAVRSILALGAIAPLVVWLRVLVDTTRDPSSHNLWPLEIAIAIGVSAACVLPPALFGAFVGRLWRRR